MLKTGRVNHIAFKVTDVDKSREFYETVVGLKKIPRPKINIPGEWYQLGENALHLIGGQRKPAGIDPTGPHVAIQVDDIDETKRTLEGLGITYLDAAALMKDLKLSPEQMKMVGKQVWVQDPDGNVLELQQRLE
ncbi:MAG TPA: VOC family protein [Candidatus Binataceae bacterium]|nr:VOC family protein [Candidatus Binataceae bacterium]